MFNLLVEQTLIEVKFDGISFKLMTNFFLYVGFTVEFHASGICILSSTQQGFGLPNDMKSDQLAICYKSYIFFLIQLMEVKLDGKQCERKLL